MSMLTGEEVIHCKTKMKVTVGQLRVMLRRHVLRIGRRVRRKRSIPVDRKGRCINFSVADVGEW